MAANCRDRNNHAAVAACILPGVDCVGPSHRRFKVCTNCAADNQVVLHLTPGSPPVMNTPITPAANNYPANNFQRVEILNPPGGAAGGPCIPGPQALSPPNGTVIPTPTNKPPNPPWCGFWTRLCTRCEHLWQSEMNLRAQAAPALAPARNEAEWFNPPYVSCTCQWKLGLQANSPRRCLRHQRLVWEALESQKDTNDAWLRSVMLININQAGQGTLVEADWARKHARNGNGTWRACPCGRDANPNPNPEAYMCMACEGFMSTVDQNNSIYNPLIAVGGAPTFMPTAVWRNVRRRNLKKIGRFVH